MNIFFKPKSQTGFSMIELLLVAAIVVILSGLALSAAARVQGVGKAAVCRGNLRQWGLATHLFAADNNDYLPSNEGQVFFTNQRILFESQTTRNIEALVHKLTHIESQASQPIEISTLHYETLGRLWLERDDRERPIVLFMGNYTANIRSGQAQLNLPIFATNIERLLNNLRSQP